MLAQPGLSRKIARIPTKNDLKAARIAQRRHLFDRGDTAAVVGLPDGFFQRPKRGLVEVHGCNGAVDVAALKRSTTRRRTMLGRMSSIASINALRSIGS